MFDVEVSLPQLFEKKGLARCKRSSLKATLIEQIGGDCRTKSAGGSRVYRVTLPAKRPLFMLELLTASSAAQSGTRFTLSIDNKPKWAC